MPAADLVAETAVMQGPDIRVLEMRFGHEVGNFLRSVEFTGKIETIKPFGFKYIRPFRQFQGYPICSRNPEGDKSNIVFFAAEFT